MKGQSSTYALFFGNRGFFPSSLIAQARTDLPRILRQAGHEVLMLGETETNAGAVETAREGEMYADFLRRNRGRFDGAILCLPNFGDETGAVTALRDADVPILIHAYPDELDKMAPDCRRDAFCGKLSVANVLRQSSVRFTLLEPHVIDPTTERFRSQLEFFDCVCRVVKGLRRMRVGAIGARTTPFKTVRVDEMALERHGITVETLDLAEVISRVKRAPKGAVYDRAAAALRATSSWQEVPDPAFENLVKLDVVLEDVVEEFGLDALAIRCWLELQKELGISPCVVLGALNDRGVSAACEVDIASAVAMRALHLASGAAAACLDWNNNYADDPDKCVLFHCGPVPASLMAETGQVCEHEILKSSAGEGHTWGCNVGRLAPFDFTFGNLMTEDGSLHWYLGDGAITRDKIPADFFGCGGVAYIRRLQGVLRHIMYCGHHHHVTLTPGNWVAPLQEALETYLEHQVIVPQTRAGDFAASR